MKGNPPLLPRRSLRWTLLALLGMLGGLMLASWPAAQAGHFSGATGGTGCSSPNMADNNTHSFFYTAAFPTYMRDAVNAARAESYDPTDINTVTSTNVNSGTDVVTYQQDYSSWCGARWHPTGGAVGHTQCVSLVISNGRCQKAELRSDESFVAGTSVARRKWLACHETGHSLGLNHRTAASDSCMWPEDDVPHIDQHDRDALNANY